MKNIVVVGGGVQGTSVAYQLAQKASSPIKITILESKEPASAASGKGGGFMARSVMCNAIHVNLVVSRIVASFLLFFL